MLLFTRESCTRVCVCVCLEMRACDSFCIMFVYFFCIAGTLGKIQTPALVNKQHKPSDPSSRHPTASRLVTSHRLALAIICEAASKPFPTQPSNANVYSPRSFKDDLKKTTKTKQPKRKKTNKTKIGKEKGCNSFGREHRPSNNPYVLIVQSTEL